ncbi:hypothetical protein Tco_1197618, partial [Tanacetum coccineum]
FCIGYCLVLPRFSGSVCLNLNLLSESVVMSSVESVALSAVVCLNLLYICYLSESAVVCLFCCLPVLLSFISVFM